MIFWGRARVPESPRHAYGLDPVRLRASAALAYEDFQKRCTISKYFPVEVLLYYYTTTQISKALELSKRELEGAEEAYFADVEVPPEALWVTSLDGCPFGAVPREWLAKAMEIRLEKRRKRCKGRDVQTRRDS
ncbi:MAG: hypothetical protein GXO07_00950 [Crenarchaeota archaeon]|nr:hypothetical protein [Thermoproteota archaeon]